MFEYHDEKNSGLITQGNFEKEKQTLKIFPLS